MTRMLAMFLMLAGAGCTPQLTQRVEGVITVEGNPVSNGEVRLASGKDATTCLGKSLRAPVRGGEFSLERQVEAGTSSADAQHDGLCIKDGGIWTLAWHGVYGPAPETLEFKCNKEALRWVCKANGLASQ